MLSWRQSGKRQLNLFLSMSLICTLLATSACSGRVLRLKRHDSMYTFQKQEASVVSSSFPRERTMQQLRVLFLDDNFKKDPSGVIEELIELEEKTDDPDLSIAITELAFLRGKQVERKSPRVAVGYYLLAAERAYDYFFSDETPSVAWRVDPTQRLMVNIYNVAVSRLVELWQVEEDDWDTQVEVSILSNKYRIEVAGAGEAFFDPRYFDELLPAYEVDVEGLKNYYQQFGVGAPLLGVRNNIKDGNWVEPFRPGQIVSSVTAVLGFDDVPKKRRAPRTAWLYFVDPLTSETITLEDDQIPLEADFTTPFAYSLIEGDSGDLDFVATVKSDQHIERVKLNMIDRFDSDKTPVVMVHGLLSGPSTWIDMFNDLRGVDEIRQNYQFWLFRYPAGLPVIYSSTLLRQALEAARMRFDPDGTSDAFNEIVLVGHSMGGLLSKMIVHKPKRHLYDLVFNVPPEELSFPEVGPKGLFDNMFFYKPLPYVGRVVFIAVPHGGSKLAKNPLSRLGASFISLPKYLKKPMTEFAVANQDKFRIDSSLIGGGRRTSVDQLNPNSPYIRIVSTIPIPDSVPYHSIIGVRRSDDGPGSSDGVVRYESAHVDGAASEVLVPAGHSCLDHPLTIGEVKRILLFHLEQTGEVKDSPSLDEMESALADEIAEEDSPR